MPASANAYTAELTITERYTTKNKAIPSVVTAPAGPRRIVVASYAIRYRCRLPPAVILLVTMPDARANINGARPDGRRLSSLLWRCVIFGRQSWRAKVGSLHIARGVEPIRELQMPYTYTLTSVIPATPEEIYEAWLDSLAHSEMTGGEASMSDEIGAEVSAWGDYIRGRNLELVPGERIVQSWRTEKFTDEHEDSTITVILEETDDGTLLTLVHSNVPDEQRNYEEGGWQSNYFEPMKAYFGNLNRDVRAQSSKRRARKPSDNVRRAAGQTSKEPAPRAKAVSGGKGKRPVAAKSKSKPKTKVKPKAKPKAKKKVARRATKKTAKSGPAKKKSKRTQRRRR